MSDCRFGVSPVNCPDPDPDPDSFGRKFGISDFCRSVPHKNVKNVLLLTVDSLFKKKCI